MDDVLVHYGTPRHSGRYPWGSGKNPYQRAKTFRANYQELKSQGLTEKEIAEAFGMSTTKLREENSLAKAEKRAGDAALALKLKDQGMSNMAIGRQMNINESSVRALLNPALRTRNEITNNVAETIKKSVDKNKYVDIGAGTEYMLGVTETRMKTAIQALVKEGYRVQYLKVEQAGTGKNTYIKVLTKPDVPWKELNENRDKIALIEDRSSDGGRTFFGLKPIQSVSSDRIKVVYAEDGGITRDGLIELRRGVKDLDLGGAAYAQVRIGVDGTHFLKGMAMYSDDLPAGIDIRFNTNKSNVTPKMDVFKEMKTTSDGSIDKDNPFGATMKLLPSEDGSGRIFAQRGALNIVNEEGDWSKWSKNLASQMLSKQPLDLIKQQLSLTRDVRRDELKDIQSITNPTVRRHLLEAYADECDSAATHLKAAALPRQAPAVILPFNSVKKDQIYAPAFENGERVVLIRYPHGGTFEIPELIVNNNNRECKKAIGIAKDAVGINHIVAERLSGADFDGDTVVVIPNNNRKVKSTPALKGLSNFDPKIAYPGYEGMRVLSEDAKQNEMGKISNLITDMTIKNASLEEISRAVRHSMVVIDATKHKLNYKASYSDNGIAELKKKYQDGGGVSTLISRANAKIRVNARKDLYKIDPETGKKIFTETGETYTKVLKRDPVTGEPTKVKENVPRLQISRRMMETDNAYSLSSGTPVENVYAQYANQMKAYANAARKETLAIKDIPYSPQARTKYLDEVRSLDAKLATAKKNAPYERKAQTLTNVIIESKKKDNPELKDDNAQLKKMKSQALAESRTRVGAKKKLVSISDKEWEAIQAGAVTPTKLKAILTNSDMDAVKKLAMPRTKTGLSSAQLARAKAMRSNGYTWDDISRILGVSSSTLIRNLD